LKQEIVEKKYNQLLMLRERLTENIDAAITDD
jgi:hypothetical protein